MTFLILLATAAFVLSIAALVDTIRHDARGPALPPPSHDHDRWSPPSRGR